MKLKAKHFIRSKSQVAIEYAHRLRDKSPHTSIFWVYASNPARFSTSYKDIAVELCLPGFDDPKTNQLDLVARWLLSQSSGWWLVILDNADDEEFCHAVHDSDRASQYDFVIIRYLPQRPGGTTLVTSRNRSAAFALVGQANRLIDVKPMNEMEARALMDKKIASQLGSEEERVKLANALGYIPLAITQAAAYISKRYRMTIAKYFALLQKDEQEEVSLLKKEGSDLRRDPEVPNSVIKTWQISFDQI